MRFLSRLALLFYLAALSVISGLVILFVTQLIYLPDLQSFLDKAYRETELRWILGLTAGVIVFLSFMFARIISGYQSKERTIAFDNPSGRVSVSLSAMEDLVKRVILRVPDVKEVRSSIVAAKKGLVVESKLILRSEMNIPELTAHLQEMVKNKIQDTIGIDETVTVRIHVIKITTDDVRSKRKDKEETVEKPIQSLPFQGYRP